MNCNAGDMVNRVLYMSAAVRRIGQRNLIQHADSELHVQLGHYNNIETQQHSIIANYFDYNIIVVRVNLFTVQQACLLGIYSYSFILSICNLYVLHRCE